MSNIGTCPSCGWLTCEVVGEQVHCPQCETHYDMLPKGTSEPSNNMTTEVKFPFLTNFTGRNGYSKCSGLEVMEYRNRPEGACFFLTPLTSKGKLANCDIIIPVSAIPELVNALLRLKNEGEDPNRCPYCGSENIDADNFDPEGCFAGVCCADCGKEWKDTYAYTGIEL